MGWRTKTFTTDSVPGQEPVTISSVCRFVRIREKPPAGNIPYVGGTAGYRIFGVAAPNGVPVPDGTGVTRYAGEEIRFERVPWFLVGETIAFISALSGTMTMEQTEEG